MRVLLFQNNVHSTELKTIPGHDSIAVNLTVRRGLKWSNLKVGEKVILRDTAAETHDYTNDGTPPAGTAMPKLYEDQLAEIFDVKVMAFNDLMNYARMLLLEQNEECRTFPGLFKIMKRVYDGFLQHELVTLVFYSVIETCPYCHQLDCVCPDPII